MQLLRNEELRGFQTGFIHDLEFLNNFLTNILSFKHEKFVEVFQFKLNCFDRGIVHN